MLYSSFQREVSPTIRSGTFLLDFVGMKTICTNEVNKQSPTVDSQRANEAVDSSISPP